MWSIWQIFQLWIEIRLMKKFIYFAGKWIFMCNVVQSTIQILVHNPISYHVKFMRFFFQFQGFCFQFGKLFFFFRFWFILVVDRFVNLYFICVLCVVIIKLYSHFWLPCRWHKWPWGLKFSSYRAIRNVSIKLCNH